MRKRRMRRKKRGSKGKGESRGVKEGSCFQALFSYFILPASSKRRGRRRRRIKRQRKRLINCLPINISITIPLGGCY